MKPETTYQQFAEPTFHMIDDCPVTDDLKLQAFDELPEHYKQVHYDYERKQDAAITAYLEALNSGMSKAEAEKIYHESFTALTLSTFKPTL